MPCSVCGSSVKKPNNSSHLQSGRHREAVQKKNLKKVKIVILGGPKVGKSSFKRLLTFRGFSTKMPLTVGIDFETVDLEIETNSGSLNFNLVFFDPIDIGNKGIRIKSLLKGVSFAVVIFDIFQLKTFEQAKSWITLLQYYSENTIPFVLLANKRDLRRLSDRCPDPEFGQLQTLALSFMYNHYVGYLDVSLNTTATKSILEAWLTDLCQGIAYKEQLTSGPIQGPIKINVEDPVLVNQYKVIFCEDTDYLCKIVTNHYYDTKLRVLTLKMLADLDQQILADLDLGNDRILNNVIDIYTENTQEDLYQTAMRSSNPLHQVVAISRIDDDDKLLSISKELDDPLFSLYAYSQVEIDIPYHIDDDKFIEKLMKEGSRAYDLKDEPYTDEDFVEMILIGGDTMNFKLAERIINSIRHSRNLLILRMQASNRYQNLIRDRMKEIT